MRKGDYLKKNCQVGDYKKEFRKPLLKVFRNESFYIEFKLILKTKYTEVKKYFQNFLWPVKIKSTGTHFEKHFCRAK